MGQKSAAKSAIEEWSVYDLPAAASLVARRDVDRVQVRFAKRWLHQFSAVPHPLDFMRWAAEWIAKVEERTGRAVAPESVLMYGDGD